MSQASVTEIQHETLEKSEEWNNIFSICSFYCYVP